MDGIAIDSLATPYPVGACAEALQVYEAVAGRFGPEHGFILESLSGPAKDRRYSVVGIGDLFGLRVTGDHLELDGPPAVLAPLTAALAARFGAGRLAGPRLGLLDPDDVWDALRTINDQFVLDGDAASDFGFFGYFAYESVWFIEKLPSRIANDKSYPTIALRVFQSYVRFQPDGAASLTIHNCDLWPRRTAADYAALLAPVGPDTQSVAPVVPQDIRYTVDKDRFLANVDVALEKIRIGDIYQIQVGHEVLIRTPITPVQVYRRLRENNPSPYMFLSRLEGIDVVGASPELFVRLQDGLIEMRPIAGTVGKRPGWSHEALVAEMVNSVKERAEHVMLVDLCRNDIGRVCQPGSLDVDELMVVEQYSHLYHMVSNVVGRLEPGRDKWDVIKATFPAGTMSGAPKIRAMELIEELESTKRGVYAGALGMIGFNAVMNTALCIRMAVHQDGVYSLRASAGVVSDSEPEKEWTETLYKIGAVYRAIAGKDIVV